jgi:hypothetical protein
MCWRFDGARILGFEMLRPNVRSRMKQADGLPRFGVESSNVGPFEPITVRACQCKIAFHGLASMLLSENVIDLKRQGQGKLRDQAVLASTASALPDGFEAGLDSLSAEIMIRILEKPSCACYAGAGLRRFREGMGRHGCARGFACRSVPRTSGRRAEWLRSPGRPVPAAVIRSPLAGPAGRSRFPWLVDGAARSAVRPARASAPVPCPNPVTFCSLCCAPRTSASARGGTDTPVLSKNDPGKGLA